jgi:hypothetical protein
MWKQQIHIEGAGSVTFKRHPRSRRLSIAVRPFQGVTVSVPRTVPLVLARAIVNAKGDWLKKCVEMVRRQEDEALIGRFDTGLVTRHHRLRLEPWSRSNVSVDIRGEEISIRHPRELTIGDSALREAVRRGILAACRLEAAEILPGRTEALARIHGFSYHRLVIKNLRSRWGSCSVRGTINLNLRAVRLPDHLMDYVILHELVHTRVNNHGPEFWSLLNSILPGGRALDRELNRHAIIP